MKLLVTGSGGQVGTEIVRQANALGWLIEAPSHTELNIVDQASVREAVYRFRPEVVINAAAYTAVDRAESEPKLAFAVNRDGPANLSAICTELDIPLVIYSTDYVFDGKKVTAYVENDTPAPLGIYGASKLAGEQAVQEGCSRYLILRTSWVFSSHGNNFVKTMLKLGMEHEQLSVVSDQYGKPTSAGELARLTLEMLPKAQGHWGVYHIAQPEATNWHDFAEEIFTEASRKGMKLKISNVKAITTEEYPTPATRPSNSELNCKRFEASFGSSIRPWRESLSVVIGELMRV